MGWPTGVEPVIAEPQSAVIPLHHGHHDNQCQMTNDGKSYPILAAYLYRKKTVLARPDARLTVTLFSYIFAQTHVPVAQWIVHQPSKLAMMVRFHPGTP